MPLVEVLLSTYNAGDHVTAQIDSIRYGALIRARNIRGD